MTAIKPTFTEEDALSFHMQGRPGEIEIISTKPLTTQRDLSLAPPDVLGELDLADSGDRDTRHGYPWVGPGSAIR